MGTRRVVQPRLLLPGQRKQHREEIRLLPFELLGCVQAEREGSTERLTALQHERTPGARTSSPNPGRAFSLDPRPFKNALPIFAIPETAVYTLPPRPQSQDGPRHTAPNPKPWKRIRHIPLFICKMGIIIEPTLGGTIIHKHNLLFIKAWISG